MPYLPGSLNCHWTRLNLAIPPKSALSHGLLPILPAPSSLSIIFPSPMCIKKQPERILWDLGSLISCAYISGILRIQSVPLCGRCYSTWNRWACPEGLWLPRIGMVGRDFQLVWAARGAQATWELLSIFSSAWSLTSQDPRRHLCLSQVISPCPEALRLNI